MPQSLAVKVTLGMTPRANAAVVQHQPTRSPSMFATRFALVGLLSLAAHAYAVAQVNVFLEITGHDALGAKVAESLRHSLSKRSLLRISLDAASSEATLRLGTLDPMDGKLAGLQTVYSVVLTMKTLDEKRVSAYVNSYLGVCGSEQARQCGAALADVTEAQVVQVLSALQERARKPFVPPR